ncbi:type II toxin-antitoxin system VapC family toxin [bacterium]|nr:type II toxin-antitoxin system VapC family toxin [bacterium]
MKRYCLDTSAYSNFKRGRPRIVKLLAQAEWLVLPSIVVGELWAGFLKGNRPLENQDELLDFLAHPMVHETPANREVAIAYAEIIETLRVAGTPLPSNDIWIAATAATSGSTVITYDAHFKAIFRVASLILDPSER